MTSAISKFFAAIFLVLLLLTQSADAQGVKRVVILKIDGLPAYFVDEWVNKRDPATGLSMLPWFEEVFYKNGTRVPNFYTRGVSLSGPAWGQLDTGQHMQLKGNVEFDRYTLHSYDYLNFLPYYLGYGLDKVVDMPAVEVLDQLRIPLLIDAFNYENRYTSAQLFQRGTNWATIAGGFLKLYPDNVPDMIDEWTLGIGFRNMTIDQTERDIVGKLTKEPQIDYFDYYDVSVDHISHHNNDVRSRYNELKILDTTLGRIWVAIKNSPRAAETALVLVSDHGFNSTPEAYSQGFNIVRMLGRTEGGGHHVVTKRRLMLNYSIKGLYPLVPLIKTGSNESFYLKGQGSTYPTALVDFDGNERSSIHLRNSDLNILHILLQEMRRGSTKPRVRAAAQNAFFDVIDRNRTHWERNIGEIHEELSALRSWIEDQQPIIAAAPKQFTPEENARGVDKASRRLAALVDLEAKFLADYGRYLETAKRLLALKRDDFDPKKYKIEDLIATDSVGDPNSLYQIQNYVAGVAKNGLVVDNTGRLDLVKSFQRINYLDLLAAQRVRSNVQPRVSNRPVDFVAVRLPVDAIRANEIVEGDVENPILVSGSNGNQLLLETRVVGNDRKFKMTPVRNLRQSPTGEINFEVKDWAAGFPLKYFEDPNLNIGGRPRSEWLSKWHSEVDWLRATHMTEYSIAVAGLNEQLDRHPVIRPEDIEGERDRLIMRFRQRQRSLVEADLLVVANNHWNFDVRGFNPGGNHGSFFRVSTNATFMIAGGGETGIPRGMRVNEPYDGLSFVPTILRLMGKVDENNEPTPELKRRGFRRFPGRVITEITNAGK